MIKVITVEKRKILDKNELEKIVEKCIKLNSNLIVFGLPWSGKSSLIKAICKKSKKFITLDEEEVTEEEDDLELRREIGSQKWAVGHQFPGMDENVSDEYLRGFFVGNMKLDTKKWTIIRIKDKITNFI